MVHFASEQLGSVHHANTVSRVNIIDKLLTVAIIVIPVLILYSIGSAWSDYRQILVQPSMTVEDYRLFCQKSDNSVKTFIGNQLVFSAGSLDNIIYGSLIIQEATDIVSCSLSVFGTVTISSSVFSNFFSGMFFDFYSLQGNIKQVDILSKLKIFQSVPLQQSYRSLNVPYSTTNLQDSFSQMAQRNITTMMVQTSTAVSAASGTTPLQINLQVFVPMQQLIVSSNLKTQLLQFIRQYMYIIIPLWFAKMKLMNWALRNRIYLTKASPNYKIH